jgi:hypothetical protein
MSEMQENNHPLFTVRVLHEWKQEGYPPWGKWKRERGGSGPVRSLFSEPIGTGVAPLKQTAEQNAADKALSVLEPILDRMDQLDALYRTHAGVLGTYLIQVSKQDMTYTIQFVRQFRGQNKSLSQSVHAHYYTGLKKAAEKAIRSTQQTLEWLEKQRSESHH